MLETDGATVGLAGVSQLLRIDRDVEHLRRGKVFKTTHETLYAVTSLSVEKANPQRLLDLIRGYWAIEIRQHYRRDHTQREDHCQVRNTRAARNLSLMRSAAIFLYELQRHRPKAKKSLPDWLRKNMRKPSDLIGQLVH